MVDKRKELDKAGGAELRRRARQGLTERIMLHATSEEKRDIDKAASVIGISTSRFAMRAALHEAELVLAGSHFRTSPVGLRPTYERILELIASGHGGDRVHMAWISRELKVSVSVLSRQLDQMERLNLVKRERIPGRRGVLLRLTENGRRAWDRLKSAI